MCSAPFHRALVRLSAPSLLGSLEPTRLSNQARVGLFLSYHLDGHSSQTMTRRPLSIATCPEPPGMCVDRELLRCTMPRFTTDLSHQPEEIFACRGYIGFSRVCCCSQSRHWHKSTTRKGPSGE